MGSLLLLPARSHKSLSSAFVSPADEPISVHLGEKASAPRHTLNRRLEELKDTHVCILSIVLKTFYIKKPSLSSATNSHAEWESGDCQHFVRACPHLPDVLSLQPVVCSVTSGWGKAYAVLCDPMTSFVF